MMSPSPAIERKRDSARAEVIVNRLGDEIRELLVSSEASGRSLVVTVGLLAAREFKREIANCTNGLQAGHDIDSFDSQEGALNRKLLRRIEVKGKGVPWEGDE